MNNSADTSVIPAKAGIQGCEVRGSKFWIPAFAGMTLLVLAACGRPPQTPTPAAETAPALKNPGIDAAELDALITQHVQKNDFVGLSVGVMQQGKIVFAKGYGLASLESKAPVTTDTMFAIASVSKQFTCAAMMLLAEDGKLSLEDRVAKYDDKLTRAADITLLDLGQHVAGYPDYYPLDFVDQRLAAARPVDEVLRDYGTRPLDFEPRTRWSYSNTGYLFMGRVVERVSGEEFGAFLTRRILQPQGMSNTGYELSRDDPRAARGYAAFGLGAAEPAVLEGTGWIAAAGGVWSTPSDLLAWDLALMDGKVLSKESWQAMITPRRLPDGRSSGYGCGQSVTEDGPALVLSHGGATSGFRANNTFIPATRSAVVLMANRDFAVINPLREAILEKLLPLGDVPAVQDLPAADAVRAFLNDLRNKKVDRSKLSEDFSAYLSDGKIASAAATLTSAEPADFEPPALSERGGMEVSRTKFMLGKTPALALMYRMPDGKIQQFLFFRR